MCDTPEGAATRELYNRRATAYGMAPPDPHHHRHRPSPPSPPHHRHMYLKVARYLRNCGNEGMPPHGYFPGRPGGGGPGGRPAGGGRGPLNRPNSRAPYIVQPIEHNVVWRSFLVKHLRPEDNRKRTERPHRSKTRTMAPVSTQPPPQKKQQQKNKNTAVTTINNTQPMRLWWWWW